jgi:hypothetical protein
LGLGVLVGNVGGGREDGEVIALTEPQVWTLIGAVSAAIFGVLGLMSTMFVRVLRTEIGGVRAEIAGLRGEMNARFETVHARLDHLDREVQALVRKVFDEGS